ncbi:MAG: hypothetical protein Q9195_006039 [Heterodermia aff. obscurata]
MPLHIAIHDPKTYYTANAPIKGTVHLTGDSDVDVSQILIIFSGRCESKIEISRGTGKDKKTDTYRGLVPLFHYETILFTGPRTLHPNQHAWDFSFQFPPRCQPCGGDQFIGPIYNFNENPHQALPPSFHLPGAGLSRKVSGSISYDLEAKLIKDRSKLFPSWCLETVQQLLVKSHRDLPEPDPQAYTLCHAISCKSMHLLPGYEHRNLTLRERFLSLRSSTLPAANFQLELRMPRTCVMGWGLPMFLDVNHDTEHSAKKPPPVVYLKRVKITLETLGTVRCCSKGRALFAREDSDKVETFDRAAIIGGYDSLKNPPPAFTERIDLCKLLGLFLDPEFFSPGFSTFNLEVRHALKVKVVVECARKTFKAKWSHNELHVYPDVYQAPAISGRSGPQANMLPAQEQNYGPAQPGGVLHAPRYQEAFIDT